ncbi:hypothetical protein DAPPUDRAFT_232949 [Daphnia pulex]|uniref:Uncharacterized protein n=1 Tax=Daphnia pulex TaxID=6669 RepID=E9FSS8_DAPPU|nr:hypothetical protein DAPPUDRAFT_232949 [Daphnia pulex]|eukprot:EFX89769.1 hypothetical protein DAPPUDRAFT_232949 [Daphnia pulex]
MAHGESFEIINLESDEEVFEEESESESVSVVNYDVEELSYNEYLNIRCELELRKVNQVSNFKFNFKYFNWMWTAHVPFLD